MYINPTKIYFKLLNFTSKHNFLNCKYLSSGIFPEPVFNIEYLCNEKNAKIIDENIKKRKGVGDIFKVQSLYKERKNLNDPQFLFEAHRIPNNTHPDVLNMGDEPKVLKHISSKPIFSHKPLDFSTIAKKLNLIRTEHLGNLTGHRSYYFLGELAELEQALIQFTVDNLHRNSFQFLSVPDILPRQIIERCGMNTKGERTQVYSVDDNLNPDLCLSGTSEMAIAGFLMNKTFEEKELPLKIAAVSKCYRAETSNIFEERGIYRVHNFTKVEMFAVTKPNNSDAFLEQLRDYEETIFSQLGLHFRLLDMPPHELGAQAYRKYDIEGWLPGREIYGEISSCSNCTDYQSRRLNIRYHTNDGQLNFVHTLNGTACAIPRMIISILETYQQKNGTVKVPNVLVSYMNGKDCISKNKSIPQLKLIK